MVDYERKVQGFLDNKNKDLTSSATRQKVWSSIRGEKKTRCELQIADVDIKQVQKFKYPGIVLKKDEKRNTLESDPVLD